MAVAAASAKAWDAVANSLRTVIAPDVYRPEDHYMRGPGPKWRAKQAEAAVARVQQRAQRPHPAHP